MVYGIFRRFKYHTFDFQDYWYIEKLSQTPTDINTTLRSSTFKEEVKTI